MAVTIVLPGQLRDMAGGHGEVILDDDPATVAEAMAILRRAHPAVYERVLTEHGEVRPHVNLFVDGVEIRRTGGLETPVGGDGEIAIIPAVSGG